jgi:hypothetical protein
MSVNICKAQLPAGKMIIIFHFKFHRLHLCDFISRPLKKHSEEFMLLQSDSEVQMGIMVLPADSGILQDSLEVP